MDDTAALARERPALVGVAYRLMGTVADAEDAVQEAYMRWYRLGAAERAAIASPGAWLTRVVSRVCLDMLGSARARRERYVGEWLPEPVPGDSPLAMSPSADPLERVTLDESVSTALLVVLEALTPAERVAFVLHDVFGMPFAEVAETVGRSPDAVRQLASQARRHVRARRSRPAAREEHDAVARAFAAAVATGDLAALAGVLDPAVVAHADGGGVVSAARRPVVGADRVARFLLGLPRLQPDAVVSPTVTADGLAFLVTVAGRADAVISLAVSMGRITDVYIVRNPAKLTLWGH
ncbi:RNA polymerase sigma factor SigJ [Microbacterium hominis]|uniref:RNA polymerase sigma factor SigJ n=1 Tax=Microbacterium hominis TaxID=162426 RepID=A0A7D4UFM1_9MICO|nr:RNA polymerase sigma factor SigJ [Microbacterium hominis]QKJ18469.1 RNA polymerase sigma factor SigJ [Microbacterium hominis]